MKIVKSLAFLTVVALPTYLVRCKNFSWCVSPIPFTLLEVLILTTFLAWIVWIAYSIRKNKDSFYALSQRLKGPFLLPLGLFVISAAVSLVTTPDLRGGLGIWKAYFVEGFLVYLVVVDLSLRKKDYFWVIKALILSGLLVSILSLFSFLHFVADIGLDKAINIRISGIYEFANAIPLYLGPIAAISVGVIISQFKDLKRKPLFYLSIISLLLILVAIFLSQSKGGTVGVFSILVIWLGYLFYKSLSKKYKKYFKYLLAVLVVFYFLLNILVYLNIDKLAPTGKYPGNSFVNRYCIWQGTRNLLSDKLATGAGLNGFQIDYDGYKTCLGYNYYYPHNIILTFWAEMGLMGLVAFGWVVYTFLKLNSEGRNEVLSVGLLAALVYIFIHGLVDVPFFKNDLSAQFWLLTALVTVNNKLKN